MAIVKREDQQETQGIFSFLSWLRRRQDQRELIQVQGIKASSSSGLFSTEEKYEASEIALLTKASIASSNADIAASNAAAAESKVKRARIENDRYSDMTSTVRFGAVIMLAITIATINPGEYLGEDDKRWTILFKISFVLISVALARYAMNHIGFFKANRSTEERSSYLTEKEPKAKLVKY